MNRRTLLERIIAACGLGWVGKVATEERPEMPEPFTGNPTSVHRNRLYYGEWAHESCDRLWVGPERQKELDATDWPEIYGAAPFVGMDWLVEEFDGYRPVVVLGVDGRWRWTQDLGIKPR